MTETPILDTETWTVGPEYEGPHFGKLGKALRDLGYALSREEYAVAGSQEIRRWRAVGPLGELLVEAETYIGLTLMGPKELVEDVRRLVQQTGVSFDRKVADELATYLRGRQPSGIPFDDAVQICMRLYCTVDGIPTELHIGASRDHLPDVFALLGASGWIHSSPLDVDVSSSALWSTVVSSVRAPTRWIFDVEGADKMMAPFFTSPNANCPTG